MLLDLLEVFDVESTHAPPHYGLHEVTQPGQRVAAVGAVATARDRRTLVRGLESIAEAFRGARSAVR